MELPHPLGDFEPREQTVDIAHMTTEHGYSFTAMRSLSERDRNAIHDKIHEDIKAGKARLEFPHDHESKGVTR